MNVAVGRLRLCHNPGYGARHCERGVCLERKGESQEAINVGCESIALLVFRLKSKILIDTLASECLRLSMSLISMRKSSIFEQPRPAVGSALCQATRAYHTTYYRGVPPPSSIFSLVLS